MGDETSEDAEDAGGARGEGSETSTEQDIDSAERDMAAESVDACTARER